jgi:carotenoid cleavage dioxygenase-like enzyme
MTTSTRSTQSDLTRDLTWGQAIDQPAREFAPIALTVIEGKIPASLRGSLYRNGPARLERGGQLMGHWFDGDGAILGIHFTDAGATGVYRFVQTAGYVAESKAGKLLYPGYGTIAPGSIWQRFGKEPKNVANTSVLALPDRLLALWEGGQPHALDLRSLETLGLDDLDGLSNRLPYSAHPKRDPITGDIFNFGLTYGRNSTLHVYRSDRTGKIQQQNAIQLDGLPMIHDFVLAGNYLVFFIPPVRLNPLPLLANLKSYSDSLTWQPQKGTQILAIDRNSLAVVSRGETEPWYQWHFGNGYAELDGSLVLDLARYEDFQTNQFLKEVATGKTNTLAKGTLWQIRLDPQTGKIIEMQQGSDRNVEFPSVDPRQVGQPNRYTYLSVRRLDTDIAKELFDAIARFDYHTGTLTEADLGDNRYPMEPIYAPDLENPDRGWVVTVVYDSKAHSSSVWIFASDRLDDRPVCILGLPSVIPFGFHGTWKPA